MLSLLDSNLQIVVRSGIIYLPLLFDPSVEAELEEASAGSDLLYWNGNHYIRSVSFHSLLESYPRLEPEAYGRLRSEFIEEQLGIRWWRRLPVDERLRMALFEVMPHFVRLRRGLKRRRPTEEEILDLVASSVSVPDDFLAEADRYLDAKSLRAALVALDAHAPKDLDLPKDGAMSGMELGAWLNGALRQRILLSERARLQEMLQRSTALAETRRRHLAALLHIWEIGSLEIQGFGFLRTGFSDELIFYVHTGEYALQDYFGRVYLFPDCRVGVSTIGPLSPIVLDRYKHPLLQGVGARQKICVRRFFIPAQGFTAKNVIRALEEGISALFYGYSSRRRNGYNRLDPMRKFSETIDFDDYRIPKDHPRIRSGEVEIKNAFN